MNMEMFVCYCSAASFFFLRQSPAFCLQFRNSSICFSSSIRYSFPFLFIRVCYSFSFFF
ncbi:Isoleucine--tRNA ligase, partial [Bienertia sinuspersici]